MAIYLAQIPGRERIIAALSASPALGYSIVVAQAYLPICLPDLLSIITYTYAALGLLQAACFLLQGKPTGLSPADRENTCLKHKPTWSIYLHRTYWLFMFYLHTSIPHHAAPE